MSLRLLPMKLSTLPATSAPHIMTGAAISLLAPTPLPLDVTTTVNNTRVLGIIENSSAYTFAPIPVTDIFPTFASATPTVDGTMEPALASATNDPYAVCTVNLDDRLPRHCFTPAPTAMPWWEESYFSTFCWLLAAYSVMSAVLLATLNGVIDWKLNVGNCLSNAAKWMLE